MHIAPSFNSSARLGPYGMLSATTICSQEFPCMIDILSMGITAMLMFSLTKSHARCTSDRATVIHVACDATFKTGHVLNLLITVGNGAAANTFRLTVTAGHEEKQLR